MNLYDQRIRQILIPFSSLPLYHRIKLVSTTKLAEIIAKEKQLSITESSAVPFSRFSNESIVLSKISHAPLDSRVIN